MFIEIFSSLVSMFLKLSLSFQEKDFCINSIRLRVFSLGACKAFEGLLLSLDIESDNNGERPFHFIPTLVLASFGLKSFPGILSIFSSNFFTIGILTGSGNAILLKIYIMTLIEDHTAIFATHKASPLYKNCDVEIDLWEDNIAKMNETLDLHFDHISW